MDSQRQQKYARLLHKELGDVFQKELTHTLPGQFITLSEVKVSPDLSVATIYMTFLGSKNPQQSLDAVVDLKNTIRNELGKRIRNQARIVPDLRFFLDNTAEEAAKIEKLLAGLNIPKE